MENFTPVMGLIGGVMIGSASILFALLTGRVAGISGILGNALLPRAGDIAWRVAFLLGLVAGPLALFAVSGMTINVVVRASVPTLIVAGFLVGLGTRIGNGCTSGHGVCGIGLGSPRSITATLVFFVTAALTVFIVRHAVG